MGAAFSSALAKSAAASDLAEACRCAQAFVDDGDEMEHLWRTLDYDRTGHLSVREVERFFQQCDASHPLFCMTMNDSKVALFRAFRVCCKDRSAGNTNATIERDEFELFCF